MDMDFNFVFSLGARPWSIFPASDRFVFCFFKNRGVECLGLGRISLFLLLDILSTSYSVYNFLFD
jgi:hypothetical protein